eukprot:gene529-1942_t
MWRSWSRSRQKVEGFSAVVLVSVLAGYGGVLVLVLVLGGMWRSSRSRSRQNVEEFLVSVSVLAECGGFLGLGLGRRHVEEFSVSVSAEGMLRSSWSRSPRKACGGVLGLGLGGRHVEEFSVSVSAEGMWRSSRSRSRRKACGGVLGHGLGRRHVCLHGMLYVEELVSAEVALGIPTHKIVIAGFSQGAATSLLMLRSSMQFAGIVAMSGYLILKDKGTIVSEENKATPILVCHGDADQVVTFKYGLATKAKLESLGASVTFKSYSGMGHSACPPELQDIKEFLQARLRP